MANREEGCQIGRLSGRRGRSKAHMETLLSSAMSEGYLGYVQLGLADRRADICYRNIN